MKEALKLGVEIPGVSSGFAGANNGIVYVRLIVNNTENKIANASEFFIEYTYQYGAGFTNASDEVGVFIMIPEGSYSIRGIDTTTSDKERNAFLNAFMTAWDAG